MQITPKTRSRIKSKPSTEQLEGLPIPQPRQQQFLDTKADIALFGGAAGSGKSLSLLLDFARSDRLSNPNYSGVIFRRTYPEIRNEGGLWDESGLIYPLLGGIPNESRLSWKFPSGATIRFSHLQHEKDIYRWQGSQLERCGWDEVSHFSRKMVFYLMTRMRSLYLTPQMRMTCNPDAESWLAGFVSWWINEFGYPIPERSGVLRWFIVRGEEVIWFPSRSGCLSEYPGSQPKSFTFISAKLTDNPALLNKDPAYLANLEAQDPVERARLLDGNWLVRKSESRLFDEEAIALNSIGYWLPPQPRRKYLIGIDPNFGGDDYFAAVVLDITQDVVKLVGQYREQKQGVVSAIAHVISLINQYNPVIVAVESNSGGKIVLERIIELAPGTRCEAVVTTSVSKMVNTDRVAIALLNGQLIYPADWIGIAEMRSFSKLTRKAITGHDDTVMAMSAGFAWLDVARSVRMRSPLGSVDY